jgi:hypothetical protein
MQNRIYDLRRPIRRPDMLMEHPAPAPTTTRPQEHKMTYDEMERELRHLEFVLGHVTASDTVPTLDYWRSRLYVLRQAPAERAQRERLYRLEQLVSSLEYSVDSSLEAVASKRSAHISIRSRR